VDLRHLDRVHRTAHRFWSGAAGHFRPLTQDNT